MIKERKTKEKEHLSFVASFEDAGKNRLAIFKDSKGNHYLLEQVDSYRNKDIYRAKFITDEELTDIDEKLDLTVFDGCKTVANKYFTGKGKYLTVNSMCDAMRVVDVDEVDDRVLFGIEGLGKFYYEDTINEIDYPIVFTARSLRSGQLYLFDEKNVGENFISWNCLPVPKHIIKELETNYGVLDELNHKYEVTSRKGDPEGKITKRYK